MGIASFVLGVLSIFFMAPLFVPLAIIFGIFGLKDNMGLSIAGMICALIGFFTSPILLGLVGLAAAAGAAS